MDTLPKAEDLQTLLIRTDFADDSKWISVRSGITNPLPVFRANVRFVDDRRFADLTSDAIVALVPDVVDQTFVFLADHETMTHPDHPLLVVDLFEGRGRTFRVVPSFLWSVQNNLVIANMDWEEFADAVDADGILREFRR